MSPALRDALRDAAAGEGCSLNTFALQILAAAAGDPARFRSDSADEPGDLRDLERDENGFPLRRKDRQEHIVARSAFFEAMGKEMSFSAAAKLVRQHEVEDPAFFVEWARRQAS